MLNTLAGIIASSGGAAAGGDYESIATVTVGSGGSSSISFTSIPSTYKHLQIRALAQTNRATFAVDDFYMTFNSDSGANYSYHGLYGDGGSVGTTAVANATNIATTQNIGTTAMANTFGVVVADILDYSDTNKYKTLRMLSGEDTNGAVAGVFPRLNFTSGSWRSTSAISTIFMAPINSSLFTQYSSFALYGIKG
jgi:hypothetical protein